jgi:hypothetical protein
VYLTPNHEEPFYVWHTTSVDKWITEHTPDALPVYVSFSLIDTAKSDYYDLTCTPMTDDAKKILYSKFVSEEDRELYAKHSKNWPPPKPKQSF